MKNTFMIKCAVIKQHVLPYEPIRTWHFCMRDVYVLQNTDSAKFSAIRNSPKCQTNLGYFVAIVAINILDQAKQKNDTAANFVIIQLYRNLQI